MLTYRFFLYIYIMYAQLGNIRFEGAKGFTSLEESFGVNYAQHERIKGKPRLEFTGGILDITSFNLNLHSSFTNPEKDIDDLMVYMANREILPLILGNGKLVGNFVITNLKKATTQTDPSGNIILATLGVELLESFTEDPLKEADKKAKDKAFATTLRTSNIRSVTSPNLSKGMVVSENVSEIQSSAKIVNQYTFAAEKDPETLSYYSKKINSTLDSMEKQLFKTNEAFSSSADIQDLGPNMPTSLNRVNTSIQNIKGALPISDINSFKLLTADLQTSSAVLKADSSNVDRQAIIRGI